MFTKQQWIKILIVMIISLAVLFSGYYIHQGINIKNPIKETISEINGVKINEIDVEKNTVTLSLKLNGIDNFQLSYDQIIQNIEPYLKERELNIRIVNNGNKSIIDAWNQSYFYIAEAVDNHQYSLIPETVESLKDKYHLNKVGYSMDEKNIFIDLHQGDSSLYIILPKNNETGVKKIG